ncbi:MAG: c-type cytochrome [Akkermansiaceae bacterium]|jgi:cytochrome c5
MKIAFVVCLALVSCQQEEEANDPSPSNTKTAPSHPWDWEPTDSSLIAGREIYLTECSGCHNEGEEGAPALSRAKEWSKRIEQGLPILFDHAINGFDGMDGEMPARGGTPSLSDEEVKNAVRFMVESTK